jgi:hypothetical protein
MDLDPAYKDHLGDPLLRLTINWRDNEHKMVEFAIAKGTDIARAMGAKEVVPGSPYGTYDTRRYSVHTRAGGHHHGQVTGTFCGECLRPTLAGIEPFRARCFAVRQQRLGEPNPDTAGFDVPNCRRSHPPVFETSWLAGLG